MLGVFEAVLRGSLGQSFQDTDRLIRQVASVNKMYAAEKWMVQSCSLSSTERSASSPVSPATEQEMVRRQTKQKTKKTTSTTSS